MKKILKVLAVMLCLAMVLGVFAACGGNDGDASTDPGSTEAGSTEAGGETVLLVATNPEFAPYEYLDEADQIVGFDVDLCNAIGEKIGVKMQFQSMDFTAVIASVNSGASDIAASGLTITDVRKESVDFSDPYYQVTQIVIARADDDRFDGATKEALEAQLKENVMIGVCEGYTGEAYVQEDLQIPEGNYRSYSSISLALEELRTGGIDAIVFDNTSAVAATSIESNAGQFKLNETALTVEDYAIAVPKNKPELLKQINDALAALKAEGKLNEMLTANGLDVIAD